MMTSAPASTSAAMCQRRRRRATGATATGAGATPATVPTIVAYSRVHTGVHYPSDTIVGTVAGVALAPVAVPAVARRRRR